MARGYQGRGLDLEDLIAEGNFGLFRAVARFDPDRGVRFSTYACHWIKQSIRVAILTQPSVIRVPPYLVELQRRLRRTEAHTGRPPAVSPRLQRHLKEAATAQSAACPGGTELVPLDTIATARQLAPDAVCASCDEQATLRRTLSGLSQREQTVLRLRFGMDGGKPQTLKAIGESLGLTRERIRQIEEKALRSLRRILEFDRGY